MSLGFEQGVIDSDMMKTFSYNDLIIDCKTTGALTLATMKANDHNLSENSRLYVKQVTLAQEAERLRIARELHDRTVQSLITLLHQSERFVEKNENLNAACTTFVTELTDNIKGIINEVRYLSSSLRPSILNHLGLVPSMEYLTKQTETDYGIKTSLHVEGRQYRFLPEVETSVFRIVQEALHNVVRHAEATNADVSLKFGSDLAELVIKDNGKGIKDFPILKEQLICKRKLGLAGMFERVELVEGEICLLTGPGEGTLISVSIPLKGNTTE